jgi:TonB family protein
MGFTTLVLLVSSADTAPRSIIVGSTLNCNKLVHFAMPPYPKEAKRTHIQGTVEVRAVITKAGNLRNIEVLKGDSLLVPAALAAVKNWRYAPCLLNSEAVEVITVLDISLNLNQ